MFLLMVQKFIGSLFVYFTDRIFNMAQLQLFFLILFSAFIASPILGKPSDWEQAQRYFFQENFTGSKALLQKILRDSPDHSEALSLLGDIQFFEADYAAARQSYLKAVMTSKAPAHEQYRLGEVSLAEKDYQGAMDHFEKSIAAEPALSENYYQLGYIQLVHARNKLKTIEFWEKFLSAKPNDPQAGKIAAAIEHLRQPEFKLPEPGSDVSLEEALLLGGNPIQAPAVEVEPAAGDIEKVRTQEKPAELSPDTGL